MGNMKKNLFNKKESTQIMDSLKIKIIRNLSKMRTKNNTINLMKRDFKIRMRKKNLIKVIIPKNLSQEDGNGQLL